MFVAVVEDFEPLLPSNFSTFPVLGLRRICWFGLNFRALFFL